MSGRDRNAPCPCGSGRKYKKCHLLIEEGQPRYTQADEREVRRWLSGLPEADELSAALFEDLPETLFDDEIAGGMADGWLSAHIAADVLGDPSHPLHDTLQSVVADHEFEAGPRAFLAQAGLALARPYKVLEVNPGHGATLQDHLSGERVRVYDPALGDRQLLGDSFVMRLVARGPSGQPEPIFPWIPFPPPEDDDEVWFIDELLEDRRLFQETQPEASELDFLRTVPKAAFRAWYHGRYGVPVEVVLTPDGLPVEDIDVLFRVQDAAGLARALADRADIRAAGTGAWEWHKEVAGQDEPVALAWLYLEEDRLLVQCIARAHALELREALSGLPGGVLGLLETVGDD